MSKEPEYPMVTLWRGKRIDELTKEEFIDGVNILFREQMELRGLGDSQRLVVTKEQFERFSKIGVSPCNMTVQEKIPLKGD